MEPDSLSMSCWSCNILDVRLDTKMDMKIKVKQASARHHGHTGRTLHSLNTYIYIYTYYGTIWPQEPCRELHWWVGGGKPESCKYVATVGNLSMVYIIYLYLYVQNNFIYLQNFRVVYIYYCHYNMYIYTIYTHNMCNYVHICTNRSHRSYPYLSRWSATRYILI